MIGRAREIADVGTLLERSRLVTIAGPGGIGKSRLAAEIAGGTQGEAGALAVVVDVAPIRDPYLIPGAIARSIGLEFDPRGDPLDALAMALPNRPLLVMLDNCEHLAGACARLAEMLVLNCPNVRVFATSRMPLGADREIVFRLGPLDEKESLALFNEQAHLVDPTFSTSDSELPVLREICKHLDGVALAIQLAASHVPDMPLGQLRARLQGHRRLSAGRDWTDIRHRNLDALVEWSYETLSQRERDTFARLAAFPDSFTAEAGVEVATGTDCGAGDATLALAALVDKSMIMRTGERYRMLAPIRQYALERLRDQDDEHGVRHAFALYYARRCATTARAFGLGSQDAWIASLSPDIENVRAALAWAHDFDPPLATRMVADLVDFWELAGLASEGLRRSEAILAVLAEPNDAAALPVLMVVARLSMVTHAYRRSFEMATRARTPAERSRDFLAMAELRRIEARARRILGVETERCVPELREALAVIRTEGNPYRTARVLADYALALIDGGQQDEGHEVLLEGEALIAKLNWPHLIAHIQINMAELEFRTGDVASAVRRGKALVGMLRPRGATAQLALALTNLASYLSFDGHHDETLDVAHEAIAASIARDVRFNIPWAIQSGALALASRGSVEDAARLLGYVDFRLQETQGKREPTELLVVERLTNLLDASLSHPALDAARADGRLLTEKAATELLWPL
jgi:predicted ATPase